MKVLALVTVTCGIVSLTAGFFLPGPKNPKPEPEPEPQPEPQVTPLQNSGLSVLLNEGLVGVALDAFRDIASEALDTAEELAPEVKDLAKESFAQSKEIGYDIKDFSLELTTDLIDDIKKEIDEGDVQSLLQQYRDATTN